MCTLYNATMTMSMAMLWENAHINLLLTQTYWHKTNLHWPRDNKMCRHSYAQ